MFGNKVNLCSSCSKDYPVCDGDNLLFGDGVGNDNIITCAGYTPRSSRSLDEQREIIAEWMIRLGYTTGHGDTIEELLGELQWQIKERCADDGVAVLKEIGFQIYDIGEERIRAAIINATGKSDD